MSNMHTKEKVLSSMIWKLLERFGTMGVQFFVQIMLARLLLPEHYGLIAIVAVFTSLANLIVQSGFNMALIQKKDANNKDFSSVLYLSFILCALLYIIIFFCAPFISNYYSEPLLIKLLRVLSLSLFISTFNSIQNAYIAKNMLFKKNFFSSLGAILISGIGGIIAAKLGFGVWALVLQQFLSQLSISLILLLTVRWRPLIYFSFSRVKVLLSFGWKVFVSNIVYNIYRDIRTLIFGKVSDSAMLGHFNRGSSFPDLIVGAIDGSLQTVLFPAFSTHQEDRVKIKAMLRRSITTSSYLVFPAMIGLALIAEPLVKVLLTDKWLPAVPFVQIMAANAMIRPLQGVNSQVINAIGRSDITLKLSFIKRGVGLALLFVSVPFGVYAIAFSIVLGSLFSTIVNAFPNKKLIDYSFKEQIIDVSKNFINSIIMGIAIYLISLFNIPILLSMIIQILTGLLIYYLLSKVTKSDTIDYLLITTKGLFAK